MESAAFKDHYEILKVPPTATMKEIERAYKKLALECHPDKEVNPTLKEKRNEQFQEILEAKTILLDEKMREQYDSVRASMHNMRYTESHRSVPTDDHSPGLGEQVRSSRDRPHGHRPTDGQSNRTRSSAQEYQFWREHQPQTPRSDHRSHNTGEEYSRRSSTTRNREPYRFGYEYMSYHAPRRNAGSAAEPRTSHRHNSRSSMPYCSQNSPNAPIPREERVMHRGYEVIQEDGRWTSISVIFCDGIEFLICAPHELRLTADCTTVRRNNKKVRITIQDINISLIQGLIALQSVVENAVGDIVRVSCEDSRTQERVLKVSVFPPAAKMAVDVKGSQMTLEISVLVGSRAR
jgi:curved DNA-binding protein CbpA